MTVVPSGARIVLRTVGVQGAAGDPTTPGGVGTPQLADGAVTRVKIANDAVGQAQIEANAIGRSELQDNAVGGDEIDDNAIVARHVADGALPLAKVSGLGNSASRNVGTTSGTVAAGDDSRIVAATPNTRQVIAGAGLSGGGNLTADRTLAVTYGSTANTAAQGNDPRLSDARTPTAHAASHATGGSDPITPASIGAASIGDLATLALGNLLPANIATASSTTGTVLSSGSTVTVSTAQAETDTSPHSWLFTAGVPSTPWVIYGGNTSTPNSSAIPVIGGQWYSLLWSVFAVGHTKATRALIYAWDSAGTLVANGTVVGANLASVSNTWQRRSATFQVPATANRIAFYLGGVAFTAGDQMHIDRLAVLQDAVGSEAWALPTVPVWRRGIRRDPTNAAQVQVWVTANTWVTV